jgi:hypothetical protein
MSVRHADGWLLDEVDCGHQQQQAGQSRDPEYGVRRAGWFNLDIRTLRVRRAGGILDPVVAA